MTAEDSTIDWHSTLPTELYTAIGRVAHSTALLDAMLGEFAGYLTDSYETWIFVSGQSTDWLIQTCRALLDMADPQRDRFPAEFHSAIVAFLNRANELRNVRNRVVHGTWSRVQFTEEPLARLWGGQADRDTFWVARDRQRRSFEEQPMTVHDVERLSDEIDAVTAGIIRAWRSVTPHEPEFPPFRRWYDLGFNASEGQ